MCTISFLPKNDSQYVLTFNRDEGKDRGNAIKPMRYNIDGTHVVFPKDTKAGGTWFAVSSKKYTSCLFNGAFEKHKRKKSYRISRGQIIIDFFKYCNHEIFFNEYDFTDVEPFTLLTIHSEGGTKLYEARWDGEQLTVSEKDATKPHIWSSVTLYDQEETKRRKKIFEKWYKHYPEIVLNDPEKNGPNAEIEEILKLHQELVYEGEDNLSFNQQNGVCTHSIALIEKESDVSFYICYVDRMEDNRNCYRIIF